MYILDILTVLDVRIPRSRHRKSGLTTWWLIQMHTYYKYRISDRYPCLLCPFQRKQHSFDFISRPSSNVWKFYANYRRRTARVSCISPKRVHSWMRLEVKYASNTVIKRIAFSLSLLLSFFPTRFPNSMMEEWRRTILNAWGCWEKLN